MSQRPNPLEGHLKKQGEKGIQTFKKRYFKQQGYKILYYKSSKDAATDHLGFIDLKSIVGVAMSKKSKDTFTLDTKDRSYRLQAYEDGDLTAEAWVEGIRNWMAWLNKEEIKKRKIQGPNEDFILAGSAPVDSSQKSGDSVVLSSKLHVEEERHRLNEQLQQLDLNMDKEDLEITELSESLNVLNEEWRKLHYAKSDLVEIEKQNLLKEIEKNKELIAQGEAHLALSDKELIQCENESDKANIQLVLETESLVYRESLLKNLCEITTSLQESQELKKDFLKNKKLLMKENSNVSLGEDIQKLETIMNATVTQQIENERLYRLLKRNEVNHKARLCAMDDTISTLQSDYNAKQNAFEIFRDEVAKIHGVNKEIFDEYDDIRKKYFFTTAVSVKLQGEISGLTPKPINLQDLYNNAQSEHPDYKEWHDFILENLFPNRVRTSSVS